MKHACCFWFLSIFFFNDHTLISGKSILQFIIFSLMTLRHIRNDTTFWFSGRQRLQEETDVPAHAVHCFYYYSLLMHNIFAWINSVATAIWSTFLSGNSLNNNLSTWVTSQPKASAIGPAFLIIVVSLFTRSWIQSPWLFSFIIHFVQKYLVYKLLMSLI